MGWRRKGKPPTAARMPVSLSDHHDERRTARSQARRSRNFVDRNYMCLRATPLFGDSTPHLASPPTVFNSSARKASSPFIGILHTGEVQGSIPCAPTMKTPCFIGFSALSGTGLLGSYRQNEAETRRRDSWKIRGKCSRGVQPRRKPPFPTSSNRISPRPWPMLAVRRESPRPPDICICRTPPTRSPAL